MQSKRILYTARKKTNISSKDVCFGQYNKNKIWSVQRTLALLKKKGLLFQDNAPLRGSSSQAVYWLTPEGIKVADEIVKEIDEYKRW
ncbi:hypothetical protein KKA33_04905 [Patescibacteria group bacterium]|nr:hypothetical protein [Patescibacteria group bacterium]